MRFVASIVLALALIASSAAATVSVELPIAELAKLSEVVVRGHVIGLRSVEGTLPDARDIATEITIAPQALLRGHAANEIRFFVHGGTVGRRAVVVPGEGSFRLGEDVVVFLMRGRDRLWLTALAQGKWSVVRDDAGVDWVGCAASSQDLVAREPASLPGGRIMRLIDLRDAVTQSESR